MRYAVNVGDLTHLSPIVLSAMIAPVTPGRELVNAEPSALDGAAVVLECGELQARAIAAMVTVGPAGQRATGVVRVYQQRRPGGRWRRLSKRELQELWDTL